MNIQFVNISIPEVFNKYHQKYNIINDFYEPGNMGMDLRDIQPSYAEVIQKIILNKNEICYKRVNDGKDSTDLLIFGTIHSFKKLSYEIVSLSNEDLGNKINNTIRNYTDYCNLSVIIGSRTFSNSESYVVGILNVTPDSFSDGGKYFRKELAVKHALKMLDDGADIIDIGGESSRPGAEKVTVEEELKRVKPVIIDILKTAPGAIISIDTTKKAVALEALKIGAKVVNDISAGNLDPGIFEVIKEYDAAVILMHMKGTPQTMQVNPYYDDVVSEVYDFLNNKIQEAKKAGVTNIIVDPGIGFGKRVIDNYELLNRLDEFKGLGFPVMVGLSRKSFLGKSLDLNIKERDLPSVVAESIAIKNGARFIRTHNVKNAVNSKKIIKFIQNPEEVNV